MTNRGRPKERDDHPFGVLLNSIIGRAQPSGSAPLRLGLIVDSVNRIQVALPSLRTQPTFSPKALADIRAGKFPNRVSFRKWIVSILLALHELGVYFSLQEAKALLRLGEVSPADFDSTLEEDTHILKLFPFVHQVSPLIGREREIHDLLTLLREQTKQLITLVGPGGVGKTQLALQSVYSFEANERARVVVVRLDTLQPHEVESVPLMIAHACGQALRSDIYPIIAGTPEQRTTLGSALRSQLAPLAEPGRPLIVVLDTFEHLLDAKDYLLPLLAIPHFMLVVTSRCALGIEGEHVMVIDPLPFQPADPSQPASMRAELPAVKLFWERARDHHPGLGEHPSPKQLEHIGQICEILEGLPLAIELTAAQARLLSIADICDTLERSSVLAMAQRAQIGVASRMDSVAATIGWSYSLLERHPYATQLQHLAAQLALFTGPISPHAVREICFQGQRDGAEVVSLLVPIINSSLIRRVDDDQKKTWYHMPIIVRQYLQAVRGTELDRESFALAHATYYTNLVHDAALTLRSSEQAETLSLLDREYSNIRSAIVWSIEVRPELAARICSELWYYWALRRHGQEALEWCQRLINQRKALTPQTYGRLCFATGWVATMQDNYDLAASLLEESIALCKQYRLEHELAYATFGLARIRCMEGQYREARKLCAAALAYGESHRDYWLTASAYNIESLTQRPFLNGEEDTLHLIGRFRYGLSIAENYACDAAVICALSINMASLSIHTGNYEEAEKQLSKAYMLAQKMENVRDLKTIFETRGVIAKYQQDYDAAHRYFLRFGDLCKQTGDWHGAVSAYMNEADVFLKQSAYSEACEAIRNCLILIPDRLDGHPFLLALCCDTIACILLYHRKPRTLRTERFERSLQCVALADVLYERNDGQRDPMSRKRMDQYFHDLATQFSVSSRYRSEALQSWRQRYEGSNYQLDPLFLGEVIDFCSEMMGMIQGGH